MPCKAIAVANQKGGTGKTATTLSLGVALARRGRRVLLVDTDPQGDLTKSLGWADPDSIATTVATHIAAVIEGADEDPRAGILGHREGVDLMPANIELAGLEMAVFMAMSRERILKTWAEPLRADYDYILFDCAPTLGIIPVNALVAADGVHIGHNALTGAEAVLVQGVALPLSQTVDDLCLLVQAGHIERNRALDAVQVIVQAAALHDKQGSRDALEVQRHAELLLKDRLDEADGLLGVIQTQKALVSFRNGNVTHNTSSYFFPGVWFYALANWLSYSCL